MKKKCFYLINEIKYTKQSDKDFYYLFSIILIYLFVTQLLIAIAFTRVIVKE